MSGSPRWSPFGRPVGAKAVRRRRVLVGVSVALAVLLVAAGAFTWWALTPLGPSDEALAALESDGFVGIESTDRAIVFTPLDAAPRAGFALYPGGRVDARSYAPVARRLSEMGYLVAIVPMPMNLAVFGPDRADEVIAAHPDIAVWGIGGHSLGGAMAASYAASHQDTVRVLALLAAYPAGSTDLSDSDTSVISVYGSRDGLVSAEDLEASTERLPDETPFVRLEGGNHAQFGSYGPQPGDNDATMSAEEQQRLTVEAIALAMRPYRLKAQP